MGGQRGGGFEVGDGVIGAVHVLVQDAALPSCGAELGVEDAVKAADRVFLTVEGGQHGGAVEQGFRMIGALFQRRVEAGKRGRQASRAAQGDAAVVPGGGFVGVGKVQKGASPSRPGVGVGGVGGQRGIQGGQGIRGVILRQKDEGAVGLRGGGQGGGADQNAVGLVQGALLAKGEAWQAKGLGVIGGEGEVGARPFRRRRKIATLMQGQRGMKWVGVVVRMDHGLTPRVAGSPGSMQRKSARAG